MTDVNFDPKGLIKDSFQIEGITMAECRSIFIDWALSVPPDVDSRVALEGLTARYQGISPEHPMLEVLKEGVLEPAIRGRRGGWAGRRANRK